MPHAYETKKCKKCTKKYCHVCWLKCPECGNESEPKTKTNLKFRHEQGTPHKKKKCDCFDKEKEKNINNKDFDWGVLLFFVVVVSAFTFLDVWHGVVLSIIGLVILGWNKRHKGPFVTNKIKEKEKQD